MTATRSFSVHCAASLQTSLQDERAYFDDGTARLRERNEIAGRYETVLRMIPTEQGFEGADGTRFCVDLRLKDDRQFSPIDGKTDIALHRATLMLLQLHLRIEQRVALTTPFCAMKRRLRVGQ